MAECLSYTDIIQLATMKFQGNQKDRIPGTRISFKGATVNDIRAQTSKMSKSGAVHHLMYAITRLLQPFGVHDSKTLFEVIRPVCLIAGWHSPAAIRPRRNHMAKEALADQYVIMVGYEESVMLRGLYCMMIHDTDYPGDFLYDLGLCLVTRVHPRTLKLKVKKFHKEMAVYLNYNASILRPLQRHTLRVLHFICLAIKSGEIDGTDVIEFSNIFLPNLSRKRKRHREGSFSLLINRKAHSYIRARQRSLGMINDRNLRENVSDLVTEASVGYVITAISTVKWYSNLATALAWDTLNSTVFFK
jgi:hypothetical protein